MQPPFRTVYHHYPRKSKAYERLANEIAPLIVETKYDPVIGARVRGVCGKHIIIRPGAGPPIRDMKVITSYDYQGSTQLYDWFEAVEIAQRRAVIAHNKQKAAEQQADLATARKRLKSSSKKARAKRVKQSRRQRRKY